MKTPKTYRVLQGGGEAPDIEPRRELFLARREWGEFKVCTHCGFSWHAKGVPTPCPDCKEQICWVEAHWTPEKAEARAREVDLEEIAAARAHALSKYPARPVAR